MQLFEIAGHGAWAGVLSLPQTHSYNTLQWSLIITSPSHSSPIITHLSLQHICCIDRSINHRITGRPVIRPYLVTSHLQPSLIIPSPSHSLLIIAHPSLQHTYCITLLTNQRFTGRPAPKLEPCTPHSHTNLPPSWSFPANHTPH